MVKISIDFIKNSLKKEEYTLCSQEYKNSKSKISVLCKNKHNILITWDSWKQGKRCIVCSGKETKTIEFFENIINSEKFKLASNQTYKNAHSNLKIICPNQHEIFMSLHSWKKGYRCSMCSKRHKNNILDFENNLKKENYILLPNQVYINSGSKLNSKCTRGHEIKISWSSWRDGDRCRLCYLKHYESKSVRKIKNILENYKYTQEYTFVDCVYKAPLRFDIALFNNSGDLIGLIEFNGRQHYESVDFFGGKKSLIEQQKRDEIKVSYCTKVNIPLLVIPYFEYQNCETILVSFLKSIGAYV